MAQVGYTANYFHDPVSDAPIHFWNERQNSQLTRSLVVDIAAQGVYANPFTSAKAIIPAGTWIDSHYAYQDPITNKGTVASVTFDASVLGIIVLSDTNNASGKLLASDHLIPSGPTAIPASHLSARGIEFGPERITWEAPNSVTLDLISSSPGDQVRIITAVPEPGSMLALAAGIGTLLARARRWR